MRLFVPNRDLLKALKGLVVMSEALENMGGSLSRNTVPHMWSSKAYPSLKPLGNPLFVFIIGYLNYLTSAVLT